MLTKKQRELLLFIHRRLTDVGVSPSFDEMREALGLKSKSGIHRLITGLEERGFIRRLPHRARALEVLKPPNIPAPVARMAPVAGGGGVLRPDFRRAPPPRRPEAAEAGGETAQGVVELPLFGRIAAGAPVEALRDPTRSVELPAALIGTTGEHYALEVDGDSMVEAGILDGDIAIVRRTDTAENGTIVVALVDDNEVTLKRLRRKAGSIALEPANPRYETRIFGPDRVRIQGRLVALLRRYG